MPLLGGKRKRNKSGYNFERCWLFQKFKFKRRVSRWAGGGAVTSAGVLKVKAPPPQSPSTLTALSTATRPKSECKIK